MPAKSLTVLALLSAFLFLTACGGGLGSPSASKTNGNPGGSSSGGNPPTGGDPGGGGTSGGGTGGDPGGGSGDPGGNSGGACGTGSADFFVATNGNDQWSGTLDAPNGDKTDGPFATLDRARRAVQGMPGGKHSVMLREGTYFLSAPVVFSAADSGSAGAPVQYSNYPCENPMISGGTPITGWIHSGANIWIASLPSGLQNFEALFYNGERRLRPRTTVSGYLYNAGPAFAPSQSESCSVEVGGQWQCFDRFRFNGADVAANYHAMALGDVQVLDFEKWTMSRMRLKSVDPGNRVAYLTGPTYPNATSNGFFPGHRYLLENVKEALTQPGQWYLDRCADPPACTSSNGRWTITYLAKPNENPLNDQVIVPQQTQLIVANGLQFVSLSGITFAHDNWVAPAAGLGDQQSSPKVSAALSFNNSSNIVLDGVTIAHTQGWGVEFEGTGPITGAISNQVVNSQLFDLGAGGVRIGQYPSRSDSDANVAQYVLVENNLIAGGGRIQPSGIGTGVWVGNSHHNTITHNEIHDFYSGAIGIGATWGIARGTGLAHDNVISYNLVYDLGQGVTSDMGGIYFASSATMGNQVLNNVVHDVVHNWKDADGYGGNGIYFDQGTSNVVARNNLVYRTSAVGLFNNLSDRSNDTYAQNNMVDNNIFAFNSQRVVQRGGDNPSSLAFTHNVVYFNTGRIQGGHWSCLDVGEGGQSVPCSTRFLLDNNVYWNAAGGGVVFLTTSLNRQETMYSLPSWQMLNEDVHSLGQDPQFGGPGFPADDYSLMPGSPALRLGFVPFDPREAGRTTQGPSVPAVPVAFPTQLKDPTSF